MTSDQSRELIVTIRSLVVGADAGSELYRVCRALRDGVSWYDWVGFYLAVPSRRLLVLGPFSGEPTEHLRIPYGAGICGQAAEQRETFVVPDVRSQSNYLACSIKTRAEVVVPVFHEEEFVGELDIDSHTHDPFTDVDTDLLHQVAGMAAPLVASILPER